jgi:hypothetical protein
MCFPCHHHGRRMHQLGSVLPLQSQWHLYVGVQGCGGLSWAEDLQQQGATLLSLVLFGPRGCSYR